MTPPARIRVESIPWMVDKLTAFRDACEAYRRTYDFGSFHGDRQLESQMYSLEPTTKEILSLWDPELAGFDTRHIGGYADGAAAATRGIGWLLDYEERQRHLSPQGPTMAADELHHWVWNPAREFWDMGKYTAAVAEAAKTLNARVQTILGVTTSDRELMQDAWSLNPPKPGSPRLRMPGEDPTSKTWKSRQEGALYLGIGWYSGVRNPAIHEVDPTDRQVALEQLAALSLLARWIEEAEVRTVG